MPGGGPVAGGAETGADGGVVVAVGRGDHSHERGPVPARLFLTADGEKDKAWGNETIRWHPAAGWLEIKLPAPLAHLANRPHGRYLLSASVEFTYRGDEVAAQAATGAVRYDISHDPGRGRWYIDAARAHGARAIVIEDLDFAEARAEGRERTGSRPSRGRRGKDFRRAISGIPTGRFRQAPRPAGLTGPRQATRQPTTVRGRRLARTMSC